LGYSRAAAKRLYATGGLELSQGSGYGWKRRRRPRPPKSPPRIRAIIDKEIWRELWQWQRKHGVTNPAPSDKPPHPHPLLLPESPP
jgi:hypothetical protein